MISNITGETVFSLFVLPVEFIGDKATVTPIMSRLPNKNYRLQQRRYCAAVADSAGAIEIHRISGPGATNRSRERAPIINSFSVRERIAESNEGPDDLHRAARL